MYGTEVLIVKKQCGENAEIRTLFLGTDHFQINGFVSTAFEWGWPLGVNWQKEAPEFLLMWSYAGCCAFAAYAGYYNWSTASTDLKDARQGAIQYGVEFREQLGIWSKWTETGLPAITAVTLPKFAEDPKKFYETVLLDQAKEKGLSAVDPDQFAKLFKISFFPDLDRT